MLSRFKHVLNFCSKEALLLNKYNVYSRIYFSSSLYHSIESKNCQFTSFGDPSKVCEITKETLEFNAHDPDYENHVLLKTIATPINPSDINIIQGKYARLPSKLPAIAGNEGLFEVIAKGASSSYALGDMCIAIQPLLGTWRQYFIAHAKNDILPLNINRSENCG